jgi:hypothetical protein
MDETPQPQGVVQNSLANQVSEIREIKIRLSDLKEALISRKLNHLSITFNLKFE